MSWASCRRLHRLQPVCRRVVSQRAPRYIFSRSATSKAADPLRVLFFGSDKFSISSLDSLQKLAKDDPSLVESIDVVCRPPKNTGRGLKNIRQVPIEAVAKELSLPLHHVDKFKGWQVPKTATGKDVNLVVAVSFGLLIPERVITQAKYGGLNVHPSLLPDLRGAAPIHRALLAGYTRTGVSLQTLHPSKMDHGQILLQTPFPGIQIPNPLGITPSELIDFVSPIGADLLAQGIRDRVFVPPLDDLTPDLSAAEKDMLRKAPKITPEDRYVKWNEWTAEELVRQQRVVGPLWSLVKTKSSGPKRVIFTGKFKESTVSLPKDGNRLWTAEFQKDPRIFVAAKDNLLLEISSVKVEGRPEEPASRAFHKLCGEQSATISEIEFDECKIKSMVWPF